MRQIRIFAILFSLFAAIALLSCSSGGGSGGNGIGTVSFALTDSSTDLYRGVYITIDDLQICSNKGEPSGSDCNWMSIGPPEGRPFPQTYNLLKLVNGVTEAIGSGEFSAGEYNQVRLIIGLQPEFETNLLGDFHPEANYVILNDGNDTVVTLKVPSGPQTGLKLVHPFTVGSGEIKELVLDFDACKSVVKAGNSGKYILKPTIKVIEPTDKIDIDGTVADDSDPPAVPIASALVSAQISDGLSTTVVRSTITEDDNPDTDMVVETGYYKLTLLSPNQIYNIVTYSSGYYPECVAFRYEDPEGDFPDLPLNFSLVEIPDANKVTVSGKVEIDGLVEEDFPLVITIYTELDCGHPEAENYVELTQVSGISYNSTDEVFEYDIILPSYDVPPYSVTYYVVASAEGYVPATTEAEFSYGDTEVTVDLMSLTPID